MTIRDLWEAGTPVYAPLCLDALSARLAMQAGFACGYVSGGALGYAHAVSEALLSIDELADVLRHVCARSELLMVVDAGVGFGDAVHVTRAVKLLEAAGAAAIEIEDQVAPKRVSHHRGIETLVSMQTMVDKVKYAVDARVSADTLIIARTGAVSNESFEQACARAHAYVEAGADAILMMPQTSAQWHNLQAELTVPLVCFGALDGAQRALWEARGVALVIDPFTPQVLQVRALQQTYATFFEGAPPAVTSDALFETYHQLDSLAGFDELYAIEDATTVGGAAESSR